MLTTVENQGTRANRTFFLFDRILIPLLPVPRFLIVRCDVGLASLALSVIARGSGVLEAPFLLLANLLLEASPFALNFFPAIVQLELKFTNTSTGSGIFTFDLAKAGRNLFDGCIELLVC